MDATVIAREAQPAGGTRFFGHPGGLATLAFTEGWVAFSYYGMQSLLVLYLTSQLLQPEHLRHVIGFAPFRALLGALYGQRQGVALASAITGLYASLAFATPVLGGLVADRLLGRTPTIVLGAVLMTIGHFLMAFDATFLIALACLVSGTGCAGVLKAQVGDLYGPGDARRADAFQIYTIAINVAVILAPIVCGWLGQKVAWHWGFGAAGVGMALGLVIYLSGLPSLPSDPAIRRGDQPHPRLTGREWRALLLLAALLPVLALTFVANQELFNGYMLWADQFYDLKFFGWAMPVSWLMSLDALISVATLLLAVAFWRWRARIGRDLDEVVKITAGAAIAALAPAILAFASYFAIAGQHKVGLGWGLAFHTVNDLGFANLYAIGLALYSRVAPARLGSTVVNAYVLVIAIANLLVGWLAGLLPVLGAVKFWLLHSAIIAVGALMLLAVSRLFRHLLASSPQFEAA
jgi:POT family proton-dependent oligopeptide transporter